MNPPINTRAIYLAVIVAIALVSAGIYFYTRATVPSGETLKSTPPETRKTPDEPADRGVSIQGGEIIEKDEEGRVLWRVKADGDLTYDDKTEVVEGANIEFEINRRGKPSIGINAPSFKADYAAKVVTFPEGVSGRLLDAPGDFSVERLEYQWTTAKIIGTGGVRFHRGHYSAGADQLVVDINNPEVRMHGNVKLTRRQ
jgi:hypothetical protein